MVTPALPITEPDPSALTSSGDQVGPCTVCHRKIRRYGHGGCPLCSYCFADASAKWGAGVRQKASAA